MNIWSVVSCCCDSSVSKKNEEEFAPDSQATHGQDRTKNSVITNLDPVPPPPQIESVQPLNLKSSFSGNHKTGNRTTGTRQKQTEKKTYTINNGSCSSGCCHNQHPVKEVSHAHSHSGCCGHQH